MNPSYDYSTNIDKETEIENWLLTEIGKISDFKFVSNNIGDLINNINNPLCVIFNDDYTFDDDGECRVTFSISIKNKGSSTYANTVLIKSICNVLNDTFLGGKCLRSRIISIENYIDTATTAKIETKSIFTRIELEVTI
jgi:hypothetical protein